MPLCCGGIGTPREPSAEEKEKFKTLLESKLESHIGRKPRSFEIVQITSQVVAGTNHFVKVKIDDGDYIHARIFEPLPCHGKELQLHSVVKDKKESDALEYF
ncbi:unnamed protein product [Schistosoma mattheei]|uniref:Cystatin domain-containing protein n=1 Tax=Schistosoma mattheei TaxID=31246 RepID=A0AA85BYD1_9TREM|nr:unnamed protein product [Schistosoma mattheei]